MGYWKKEWPYGEYSPSKYVEPRDNKGQFVIDPNRPYYSGSIGDTSEIRVPSLKRKSAWKRFYKMFPELKGQKVIHGKSSCGFLDRECKDAITLRPSTIKLKKI